MSVYLHDIPLEKALAIFYKLIENNLLAINKRSEKITIDEHAVGRVLSAPVWAKISSPHYHASAMDGFAVRAEETVGASLTAPLILQISSQSHYLDTGDPLPKEFNAVIPIENTEALNEDGEISDDRRNPAKIRIRESVQPWHHIRVVGEDMVATQLVLPENHTLQAHDLGAIIGSGNAAIEVYQKPRITVIPTGTELVEIGTPLKTGDILEYNAIMLTAKVNQWGANGNRISIVEDDFNKIKEAVQEATEDSDLILLNAGSSAGAEDFSSKVIDFLGEVLVHGIAVRPGHPVILGVIDKKDNTKIPIIGVPGYPVSAAMTVDTFVKPFLNQWFCMETIKEEAIEAKLIRNLVSNAGDDDFVRVVIGKIGKEYITTPLARGAGVISSLVKADGILKVPSGSQGFRAGEKVKINLIRTKHEIDQTILSVGSHDLTLDILAHHLAKRKRRFSTAHVGSLAGLIAVNRNETHISQAHLFDKDSQTYNIPFIKKYINNQKIKLVEFVQREQGFIVPKGNPKNVQSFKDFQRNELHYVNRQLGAGTRVLFDYYLEENNLSAENISGYANEEFSHLSVAVAVKSGRADFGMGIAGAAQAMDLDFIPICEEEYQLIISTQFYESELLAPLFEVLCDTSFVNDLKKLYGYRIKNIGTIVFEN